MRKHIGKLSFDCTLCLESESLMLCCSTVNGIASLLICFLYSIVSFLVGFLYGSVSFVRHVFLALSTDCVAAFLALSTAVFAMLEASDFTAFAASSAVAVALVEQILYTFHRSDCRIASSHVLNLFCMLVHKSLYFAGILRGFFQFAFLHQLSVLSLYHCDSGLQCVSVFSLQLSIQCLCDGVSGSHNSVACSHWRRVNSWVSGLLVRVRFVSHSLQMSWRNCIAIK